MYIEDLAKAVIESKDGSSVAEQFLKSYQSGNFEQHNPNALKYIKYTLQELLESDLLAESESGELVEYFEELKEYVKQFNY